VDLSDSEQVVALAAFALHTFGRVDILVRARNPNLQSVHLSNISILNPGFAGTHSAPPPYTRSVRTHTR
jgi:hypothetical protein